MSNLYINRVPINNPWGGGNNWVAAMYKYAAKYNYNITDSDIDAIFIAGLDDENRKLSAEQIIQKRNSYISKKYIPIIFRVNENDARKATNGVDDRILKIIQHCDGIVFVSNWIKQYFVERGFKSDNYKHCVIYNGVDKEIYYPRDKLNNNKINIVTHHWSNNKLKGFDYYDLLDEFISNNTDFTFTYIGREQGSFKNTTVIQPLFGKALGNELGKYDIYISASRFDPGPNHCSEAIASNIPTYVHIDGGGCVEFCGTEHTYSDWNELKNIILSKNYVQNKNIFQSWDICIENYLKFVDVIIQK